MVSMDEVIEREIWKPAFEAGFRLIGATGFDRTLDLWRSRYSGSTTSIAPNPSRGPSMKKNSTKNSMRSHSNCRCVFDPDALPMTFYLECG
jgi:hypothetical protein